MNQMAQPQRSSGLQVVLAALVACVACNQPARGQERLPTDIELKTAYCIGVTKEWTNAAVKLYQLGLDNEQNRISGLAPIGTPERFRQDIESGDPKRREESRLDEQRKIEELNSRIQRMQAYILPRLKYLDLLSINSAITQAKRDMARKQADSDACSTTCPDGSYRASTEALFACLDKCELERGTPQPYKSCKAIDWLPF